MQTGATSSFDLMANTFNSGGGGDRQLGEAGTTWFDFHLSSLFEAVLDVLNFEKKMPLKTSRLAVGKTLLFIIKWSLSVIDGACK